jgi:hypothetical protein
MPIPFQSGMGGIRRQEMGMAKDDKLVTIKGTDGPDNLVATVASRLSLALQV